MSESTSQPVVRERRTDRTARYALVGAAPAAARRIWFVLHGYGMLATRFVRPFLDAVPDDTCVVAPEGLSRFYLEMPRADGSHQQRIGATWLTRESRDTEIADAHGWLDRVHDEVVGESAATHGIPPATAVLGFSQGVSTAMRWIGAGVVRPRQFVAWAGGPAHDVDAGRFTAKMADAELTVVVGTRDEFATEAAQAAAAAHLQALQVTPRVLSFEGGHHLDTALLRAVLAGLPVP